MTASPEEMTLFQNLTNGLLDAIKLLGDATVPVALFVLGGMLGEITFTFRPYARDALRVMVVKLLIIPFFMVVILHIFMKDLSYSLLAVFLVIQSAAAPAVSIMLQIKRYGGDEQKVGSILLVSYGVCMVTLPVWVAVWELLQ
jgi:predicted permease